MSSQKALNAILPQIAAGSAYEAHQKARTFAARYQKSGQYDVAIDVLFQSARELLKTGQTGSGTDLGSFLLEVYESKGENASEESRGRLTQLIALTGPAGNWRKVLIDKCIAWSAKHGPNPSGDVELHHYVGELLYKEGAYDIAEHHLLAAGKRDSGRILGEMFTKWAQSGGTPGAFALRGVLPYLVDGNLLAARAFISSFISGIVASTPSLTSSLSSEPVIIIRSDEAGDEIVLTVDPVLNWTQLAVQACQRARGADNKPIREAWVRLCGTYQARGGLLTQPYVRQALQEISTLYFAIPPPRQQNANPFGDMLSAMMGGGGGATSQPAIRRLAPPPATGLD